jgi:hypothetical protein
MQLIVGIILGTVRPTVDNAAGILVMQVLESLGTIFLRPYSDRCVLCTQTCMYIYVCTSVSYTYVYTFQ